MIPRSACSVAALISVLAIFASQGAAQTRRVKAKGELVSVAPGKILVIDAAKKVLTFNITEGKSLASVKGNLTPADLKTGMSVRVSGSIKGAALDGEVSAVTVFSAADGYVAGVVQDSKDQPADVTGVLSNVKGNTLTIQAGRRKLTAKLAEGAAITVDSKDYSLAPAGSLVVADGYETKDGSVNAKKVEITLATSKPAEPKGSTKKK